MKIGQENKACEVETVKDLALQESDSTSIVDRKRKYETLDAEKDDEIKVKEPRLEIQGNFNLLYSLEPYEHPFKVLLDICGYSDVASMASVSKKMLSVAKYHLNGLFTLHYKKNPRMNQFVPSSMHLSVENMFTVNADSNVTIHMNIDPEYDPHRGSLKQYPKTRLLDGLQSINSLYLYDFEAEDSDVMIGWIILRTRKTLKNLVLKGSVSTSVTDCLIWLGEKETMMINDLCGGTHTIPPVRNLRVSCRGGVELVLPHALRCLCLGEAERSPFSWFGFDFEINPGLKYLDAGSHDVSNILARGIPDSLTHLCVMYLDINLLEVLKNSKISHLFVDKLHVALISALPVSIKVLTVRSIVNAPYERRLFDLGGDSDGVSAGRMFLRNPTYAFGLHKHSRSCLFRDADDQYRRMNEHTDELSEYDLSHLINLEELVVPHACKSLTLGSKLKILVWGTSNGAIYGKEPSNLVCEHQPEKLVCSDTLDFDLITVNGGPIESDKYLLSSRYVRNDGICADIYDVLHRVTA